MTVLVTVGMSVMTVLVLTAPAVPVRVAAVLSLGSSAVSALLAFYLTFVGAYSALTPVSMLLYLLLWALAALIEGFWADRY